MRRDANQIIQNLGFSRFCFNLVSQVISELSEGETELQVREKQFGELFCERWDCIIDVIYLYCLK